jgi:hypothetical protein
MTRSASTRPPCARDRSTSARTTGARRCNGFKDSDIAGAQGRLRRAVAARQKYVTIGQVDYQGTLLTQRTHFTAALLDFFGSRLKNRQKPAQD